MASLPLCSSCRKVVQERIYLPFQLQPYSEHYILRRLYRPIRDVRKYAVPAASSPAPYQQKKVVNPGKSTASESTSPTNKSTSTKSKQGTLEGSSTSTTESIAASVRKNLPGVAETYVAYSSSEKLVRECGRQAQYSIPQSKEKNAEIPKTKYGAQLGVGDGWWYTTLGLDPTFETWAQVTFLHMYLITVRLRCFPAKYVQVWHQHLIDHFSYLAEDKMAVEHKMVTRGERQTYLKDIFVQWRGLQTGYDEGLVKGDAVLATAVWRNVFRADPEVDWQSVAEVVSYMRHVLRLLGDMSDGEIACGDLAFGGNPGSERPEVLLKAKGMDERVSSGTLKGAPAKGRIMPEAGK